MTWLILNFEDIFNYLKRAFYNKSIPKLYFFSPSYFYGRDICASYTWHTCKVPNYKIYRMHYKLTSVHFISIQYNYIITLETFSQIQYGSLESEDKSRQLMTILICFNLMISLLILQFWTTPSSSM